MHNKDIVEWYKLDTAGKLYPAIRTERATTLFRISIYTDSEINPAKLQEAVEKTLTELVNYQVILKRGFFQYYFDRTSRIPKVSKELNHPCMNHKICGNFPFRVLYFGNKISVEFSHCFTDGLGSMLFVRHLLSAYFDIPDPSLETVQTGRLQTSPDPYKGNYDPDKPWPTKTPNAFHFPYAKEPAGVYHLTHGRLKKDEVKSAADGYGTSMTILLCSVYFRVILDLINDGKFRRKPVVINMPVNLRQHYDQQTHSNFFVSLTPSVDPRLGDYNLEEIIEMLTFYLKINNNQRTMNQYIKKNVQLVNNPLFRLIPLPVKNLIMQAAYAIGGEWKYTTGFSNVGRIVLPEETAGRVLNMEISPAPSSGNGIKLVCCGYGDNINVVFGTLLKTTEVERRYFRKLREMGMSIYIESSRTGA